MKVSQNRKTGQSARHALSVSDRTRFNAFALVLAFVALLFASCGGGGGGDGGLAGVLAASIDGGLQSAPDNVINASTAGSVTVTVETDPSMTGDETVTVRLSDGVNSVTASGTAPAGGGGSLFGSGSPNHRGASAADAGRADGGDRARAPRAGLGKTLA